MFGSMDGYSMDSRGKSMTLDLISAVGTANPFGNMPAAVTEFNTSGVRRYNVDLKGCRRFKLSVEVVTALGVAGAKLGIQYSDDGGSTWKGLDNNAVNAQSNAYVTGFDSFGHKISSEGQVTPSARKPVLLRIVGSDGDGVADPQFRNGVLTLYP